MMRDIHAFFYYTNKYIDLIMMDGVMTQKCALLSSFVIEKNNRNNREYTG
ncbi:MAG: hypothetical protein N4A63_01890 [Vallitalea sp.]|jgi:hypothetical protein|nr:hypothetical protein [Vallitalea sp.]